VCVPRARGVWRAGVRPRPWTHAHVRRGRTVLKMFDVHGGGEDHLARALAAGSFWVGLVRTQLDRDWPCPCAFFLCHRLEHASENGLEIPGASVSVLSSFFWHGRSCASDIISSLFRTELQRAICTTYCTVRRANTNPSILFERVAWVYSQLAHYYT